MGEQINRILWDESQLSMEIAYTGSATRRVVANQLVAKMLAEEAGLVTVPSRPGTISWAHAPDRAGSHLVSQG